jgi:hypothetical protein
VSDSGPLAVRARTFDKDGGYVDSTTTITFLEKAPTAVFSLVGAATSGVPATFRFSNATDAPADATAGFTYGFDFDNDGVFEVQRRTPQAATVFPARGLYTVRGIIMDQDGAFTIYTLTVNVPI